MTEVQNRKKGMAVASFICGILFIFGPITGIPALVLGILALNNANKQGDRYGGKGFAVTGIVLSSVGILLLPLMMLAAIGIPQYVRAVSTARQAQVKTNLSTLYWAVQEYYLEYGEYPDTLQDLQDLPAMGVRTAEALRANESHTYTAMFEANTFFIAANPREARSGLYSFCVTDSGDLHVDRTGIAIESWHACQALPGALSGSAMSASRHRLRSD
ncbi:MAG: DUF4190 domain-containing protein [Candidatus Omnitrophica bacterium]|nr:DUF4190 domain-containing protein [Candidatus Omnitrophota bacterium]